MSQITANANSLLATLLQHHGIQTAVEQNYLVTDLPALVACQATAYYEASEKTIHSTMHLVFCTDQGDTIEELCADLGTNADDAMQRNIFNFANYALHPLLAALGSTNPHVLEQVTKEEWTINNQRWDVYIGNLAPKMSTDGPDGTLPPMEFFSSIEHEIRSMSLNKPMHWVSSFYSQVSGELGAKEFWLDNETPSNIDNIFTDIPIIPDVTLYTCRNFIVLRSRMES